MRISTIIRLAAAIGLGGFCTCHSTESETNLAGGVRGEGVESLEELERKWGFDVCFSSLLS